MTEVQIAESIDRSIAELNTQLERLIAARAALNVNEVPKPKRVYKKRAKKPLVVQPSEAEVVVEAPAESASAKKSVGRPAKLTQEIADQIRAAEGSTREIGRQFGISGSTVSKIKNGRIWKVAS